MKTNSLNFAEIIVLSSFALFGLTACQLHAGPGSPKFKNSNEVKTAISEAHLFTSEDVVMTGKLESFGGKSVPELEIKIVNGNNLPFEKEQRTVLAHELASTVKSHLKNPEQYQIYKVVLTEQIKNETGSDLTTASCRVPSKDL